MPLVAFEAASRASNASRTIGHRGLVFIPLQQHRAMRASQRMDLRQEADQNLALANHAAEWKWKEVNATRYGRWPSLVSWTRLGSRSRRSSLNVSGGWSLCIPLRPEPVYAVRPLKPLIDFGFAL
jgi:hypothetical protein